MNGAFAIAARTDCKKRNGKSYRSRRNPLTIKQCGPIATVKSVFSEIPLRDLAVAHMPTYQLVIGETGAVARVLSRIKMCFLNVLRLHVSQNQRQKRLYKQYMEQLAGAYVERCTDLSPFPCDRRYNRVPTPEWKYNLSCDEHYWYSTECSRSCCGSECSDSRRCSSPCCSEVIFNGGQHFSGKRSDMHVCYRLPVCYPGNFGACRVKETTETVKLY